MYTGFSSTDGSTGGLTALLSEDSVNCCRERAQKMLDSGIYQINSGAYWFEDGWDEDGDDDNVWDNGV